MCACVCDCECHQPMIFGSTGERVYVLNQSINVWHIYQYMRMLRTHHTRHHRRYVWTRIYFAFFSDSSLFHTFIIVYIATKQ